jgi:hypothetical protein
MDKKYLHHLWTTRIKPVRLSFLLVALLASVLVSTLALRDNNLTMVKLREGVRVADEKNGDVEKALYDLRAYVYSHMNTSVSNKDGVYPQIQLQYTYQRLVQAEQKRVATASAQIYSDAQAECERQYPDSFSGGPRVPCIQKYVTDHGVATKKIPDSIYKFDFKAAKWSPDLAGWSVAVSVLLGIIVIIRLGLGLLAKKFL